MDPNGPFLIQIGQLLEPGCASHAFQRRYAKLVGGLARYHRSYPFLVRNKLYRSPKRLGSCGIKCSIYALGCNRAYPFHKSFPVMDGDDAE